MNLESLRKQSEQSQEGVARVLGVTSKTYWRWEKGFSVPPTTAVSKLAELYGVSGQEILDAIKCTESRRAS